MPRIALLSTSDTDLLSARASGADYVWANPARSTIEGLRTLGEEADLVVARFLGSPQSMAAELAALAGVPAPLVVLGGEVSPDAALMACSTVPLGTAAQAHVYLAHGGPGNLASLHAFLSDAVLLTGRGFEPPVELPQWGELPRPAPTPVRGRPRVGVLFYRAQYAAGNAGYARALADAVDGAGGVAVPIFTTSLRDPPPDLLARLGTLDALVTTVLAAGGTKPASAGAGGDDEAWDVRALAALDIPVLQGLCLTWGRDTWTESPDGMSPLDVATQVAVPEFDGRLITVPFSFKEIDADGLPRYAADPERCRRVARIAVNHGRLRHVPPAARRIAIVLSAYPTKHARIGNAVGLDTPASLIKLLRAMREAGYDLGEPGEIPGTGPVAEVSGEDPDTTAGTALVHALIEAGGQDPEWLTSEQLTGQPVRIPAGTYRRWLEGLPAQLVEEVNGAWGPAPGDLFVDRSRDPGGEIVAATLRAGNVVILIQPPRGFGENPIAIYHDPDLAPSHHYLATYRWLEEEFGAHAIVHLGKHGNLEWLPGKHLGLSAACGPDAALGSVPLIYPFLVNDPGEGTQAKRRAHATIIDHLVPPMARAESYGDVARLEQLLDEYAQVSAMDPAKAPALEGEIWTLMQAAQLDADLGLSERPSGEEFGEFVLHVDGWLCEIKDVQIRDGLHVLGRVPEGPELVNLVLAILRCRQMFGGQVNSIPGLRAALGETLAEPAEAVAGTRAEPVGALGDAAAGPVGALGDARAGPGGALGDARAELVEARPPTSPGRDPSTSSDRDPSRGLGRGPSTSSARGGTGSRRDEVDAIEAQARRLVEAVAAAGWEAAAVPGVVRSVLGAWNDDAAAALTFACREVVPRLRRTDDEIAAILHALDGGYVPAGPSGSPLRGLVNVLPTGRNFYSVDPKAIPSPLAYQTGQAIAESLLRRHLEEAGRYPSSVGLSVWGTSAMRTSGDDIGEVLALLGVVPVWDEASRRVIGLEPLPLADLGRPRIDVTVRISGFFRDAFPHVVAMLDDAVRLVVELDESDDQNYPRAHARADLATHGDPRRARTRIFGSKPGSYGAGLLPLMDAGNWRDDGDLAEVYAAWGGFAYGRGLDGVAARDDMEANYRRIAVAAKNVDAAEHDIADSDDYFQYHGGMVATVRALTGTAPKAYVGDSTAPDAVRTRSLTEETARIFRARVVNPRWIAAMRRHGYKGAFELAATVDYLFGFDATAHVVSDWMYQRLAENYVLDEQNQDFFKRANPWALRGIIEKLGEAADRGLWAEPDPDLLAEMAAVYLDVEGDLEEGG